MISDSVMFAYKSGMDQIPEFILMDRDGKGKIIYSDQAT